jgi:hypothetical protein
MANHPYLVAEQREGVRLTLSDSTSRAVPLSRGLKLSDASYPLAAHVAREQRSASS